MGFDLKVIYRRIQISRSHASRCHHYNDCRYCNVDFVLFHNVTNYTNFLLSRIHVSTTCLLTIPCTLIATSMILGRFKCILVPEHYLTAINCSILFLLSDSASASHESHLFSQQNLLADKHP